MMLEKGLEKDKIEAEALSEKKEAGQEKSKEKAQPETEGGKDKKDSDSSKDNTTKKGFWKRSWENVKTGTKKKKRKLIKAFSKEPDDMSDEEFNQYLQDEEADGNEGYAARYYALIEELRQMPSLMQFAKDAEPKDISDAVSDNAKSDEREEKKSNDAEKTDKESEQESETQKEPKPHAKNDIEEKEQLEDNTGAKSEAKEAEPETAAQTKENEPEAQQEVKAEETKTESEVKTGETKTEETKSEETKSEETKTEETKSEETKTEETKSEETKTEENKNKEAKPETKEEKAESTIDKLMDMKEDGVNIGNDAVSIYKSSKRRKALEELEKKTDPNSAQGRQLAYMKEQAKKESVTGGFSIAKNIVDTVNKAIGKFASEKVSGIAAKISKLANMALEFGKNLAVKKQEKNTVKQGLKGLLGGSEVYEKLKDKYKLNGGAMRRAIRVAANRSSVQDLVDADKDKLSEEYEHNIESKDEKTNAYMGLAGGRNADAARKSMGRSTADTKEKKEEQEGR